MTDSTVQTKSSDSTEKGTVGTNEAKPPGDSLGPAGKRALDAEREARKKAEGDLAALRNDFDGFRQSLSEALGVKGKDDDESTLESVQDRLKAMQHDTLVYQLAAKHQITDEDDLELLKAASSEHAPKLAERLADKAEASKPATPKPDRSQGGSEQVKPDPGPGVARMAAGLAEAIEGSAKP